MKKTILMRWAESGEVVIQSFAAGGPALPAPWPH